MSLLFCSSDGVYCAQLLNEPIETIHHNLAQFHPLETGGILIGCYDENLRVATIHIATPAPPDSKHGPNFFDRGIKGIKDILSEAKSKVPSLHYIGEWHSHPSSNPRPSNIDVNQMQKFASKSMYGSRSPLLLIVGGNLPDELTWSMCINRFLRRPIPLMVL